MTDSVAPRTPERLPHAVLDLASRRLKGRKIERLLGLGSDTDQLVLLEVGTGSGGIAHYFGTHARLNIEVHAVDVCDSRQITEGYHFRQVADTALPYPDETFDIVLSNHVIEHVGDERAQRAHLSELHRVIRPGGIGYLAVPNRWMLVEPHYKLAFLSWLPEPWRTPYLKLMGKGDVYDCRPLKMQQLEKLLAAAGFSYRNLCVDALRATFEIERPNSHAARVLRQIPDACLRPLRRAIPTLIYRFERAAPADRIARSCSSENADVRTTAGQSHS